MLISCFDQAMRTGRTMFRNKAGRGDDHVLDEPDEYWGGGSVRKLARSVVIFHGRRCGWLYPFAAYNGLCLSSKDGDRHQMSGLRGQQTA